MERWIGKIALVTGASAGIGEVIAKVFVLAGLEVVGLARRVDRIEALADSLKGAKGKLHAIKCDLTNEQEILKAFDWTNRELGGVDVLVNNAGLVAPAPITGGSTEDFKRTLDVNVLAAAICTREAMKSMKSRDTEGHIFYINSVLGYVPTVTKVPLGLYTASKFAMRGLAESVKQEIDIAKDNIKITSIIPGLVRTDIFSTAGGSNEIFNILPYVETKDIADGVLYALSTSPYVCVDEVRITPLRRKL